jgi:two-component system response regulator AtoC
MAAIEGTVAALAKSDVPILLIGESGVGKHALAQEIHRRSSRSGFLAVAASELGSKLKAEYSGLGQQTLFLSHICELSSEDQGNVFELLVNADNGDQSRPRLIASATTSLQEQVRKGVFREDLFYLLGGVCLHLPPLRGRREDIPILGQHFARKYSALFRGNVPLRGEALSLMAQHSWPGNVRELEEIVKRTVAFGDSGVVADLLRTAGGRKGNHTAMGLPVPLKQVARLASWQAERALILDVLSRTRWNRKRAAMELQISYKALLYKLKQIGIQDEDPAVRNK